MATRPHTSPRTPTTPALVLIAALAAAAPAGEDILGGRRTEPLMDLAETTQRLDIRNFQLSLRCDGVAPNGSALLAALTRAEGKWYSPAVGRTPRYNAGRHVVDPTGLKVSEDGISGKLAVVIKPDQWVPKDGKERSHDVSVAAKLSRQGGAWSLKGTCSAEADGQKLSGEVSGTFGLAQRDAFWNTGTWDDGLNLRFDMGTKRVNWNHGRWAIHVFRPARDLAAYWGLRVKVATDSPRDDAEVALWLGEADGTWYYVKSAVPLVDKENQALIPFEDFVVAEWVCPGAHMDEDYVLDLKSIGAIAIGVVNPLGVGEVAFKLTGLDLVKPGPADARRPADVEVTGRTLSINDHDKVMAGIFGGYCYYVDHKYRPGCQRNLSAPSYPQIPRQAHVRFFAHSFHDWPAVMRALRGETAEYKKLSDHLLGLIADERELSGLKRFDIDRALNPPKPRAGRKPLDPKAAPRELTAALSGLLRRRELYDKAAWAAVKLTPALKAGLARLQKGQMSDTEVMEFNRPLLEAAFAGLIKPLSKPRPTEMFYIDCFGERKNTATLLHNANWKQSFEDYGRRLALNAKAAGCDGSPDGPEVVWEFWNEPYLHWGAKDRVNLRSAYYREDLAKENGPVMVKRKDADGKLVDGEVIPHFRWVKGRDPKGLRDAVNGLYVEDETAFTYWSGSGNGWLYDQMFAAAAASIKKHNPHVTVIAGWGFRWNEDHWDAWRLLYKNTIDRGIQWIDGVHEHHYQGDTTAMNGTYEVLTAYGVTKHDKWLYSYNTETNDLVDAPARGAVSTPEKALAAREYRRMVYNLRDLIYCVLQSSDKFRARTWIHTYHTPEAERVCLGLLKDLRGRLVEARSSDGGVWSVASIDGTDARAMPPDFDGTRRLVVVIYNDRPFAQKVNVTVQAPTGTTLADGAFTEQTTADRVNFTVDLARRDNVKVGKTGATFAVELDDHMAWKVVIPLKGDLPEKAQVRRKQFFSPDLLQKVRRGKPFRTAVKLDPAMLKSAKRAYLRLVVEDVGIGEAAVTVAGQEIALPKAFTADNVNDIVELPVDLKALKPVTPVVFSVAAGNFAGYQVDMTSIVLEQRDE